MKVHHPIALGGAFISLLPTANAVDESAVPGKWHTPYDLYLSAREAYEMKTSRPDEVLFIDVRTQVEGFGCVKARSGPDTGNHLVAGWKHEGLPWSRELVASKMYVNVDPTRRARQRSADDAAAEEKR